MEDRVIPGQGDLIAGAKNTHIATLVERQSRFTMLVKVPGKDTASVVTALSRQVRQLLVALRRSLTWDRGLEVAQHKRLTVDTKVQVYSVTRKAHGSAAQRTYEPLAAPVFPKKAPICRLAPRPT